MPLCGSAEPVTSEMKKALSSQETSLQAESDSQYAARQVSHMENEQYGLVIPATQSVMYVWGGVLQHKTAPLLVTK